MSIFSGSFHYKDKGNSWDFKIVYLNYCNKEYDVLASNHENYKYSCKHTQTIIDKYDLENVIKVPKSQYVLKNERITNVFLGITSNKYSFINYKTDEVLAHMSQSDFWGGWYLRLAGSFIHSSSVTCNKRDTEKFKETVIPNPYKKDKR